jgi:hypothetical protein
MLKENINGKCLWTPDDFWWIDDPVKREEALETTLFEAKKFVDWLYTLPANRMRLINIWRDMAHYTINHRFNESVAYFKDGAYVVELRRLSSEDYEERWGKRPI